MKKTALLVTLLVFATVFCMTSSYSAPSAGNIPDVTGYYEGSNTRFFPNTLTVETQEARFYIWDQEGQHFWGSVNYKPSDSGSWLCAGYINGVNSP